MSEKQQTLAKAIHFQGKGLHTGLEVMVKINPAEENFGVKFQRVDLEGKPIIHAFAENVIDTSRGTTIEENGARVYTVEHLLASLTATGIDNALIEINAPETPIFDGSAKFYLEEIEKAGLIEQNANRKYFILKEKIQYTDEEKGIEIIAYPDDQLSVSVWIDYKSDYLKNQFAELTNISDFKSEISSCRTFVFFHELELLLKNNLIKGGDLSNAIVIIDKEIGQEELDRIAKLFNKPSVQVKPGNILSNPDLQFNNEPARHKILDIIGDISLAGMPIKAKIFAKRPGHHANTEFAKIIRKIIKKELLPNTAPVYDPNKKPLYDINDIKNFLPHRPPFLLVDKIIEMSENQIVGLKNVTMNEPFFVGHFPNEPVMPGVLMIEAMAQVGGIFALSKVPDPNNYLTLFLKIDQIKFRDKVVPGDTLIFKLQLLSPIRRGIVHMRGVAFVGEKAVFEGELMAQLIKVK